ncbi:hypothetical protein BGZ74_011830 [Mortierella antarctica]|nr:hypothetical protein BGZ74_011830 [Mortierella antarctica]
MSNSTTAIAQLNSTPEPGFDGLAVTGFFFLGFFGGILAFVSICCGYVFYQRRVVYNVRRPRPNIVRPRNNFDTVVVIDPIPVRAPSPAPAPAPAPDPLSLPNSLPLPLPQPPVDAYFDKDLPARPSSLLPDMFDLYSFDVSPGPSSPRMHHRRSVGSIVRASVASSTTLGLALHNPTLPTIPSSARSSVDQRFLRRLRSVDSSLCELYGVAKRFLNSSQLLEDTAFGSRNRRSGVNSI